MALVKNKKVVETVGELKKWLTPYPDDMPLYDYMGKVTVAHLVPKGDETFEDERGAIEIYTD